MLIYLPGKQWVLNSDHIVEAQFFPPMTSAETIEAEEAGERVRTTSMIYIRTDVKDLDYRVSGAEALDLWHILTTAARIGGV
jgi:hypothetical protein